MYTTDTNYLIEAGVVAPMHVRKALGIEGVTVDDGISSRGSDMCKTDTRTGIDEKGQIDV